MERKEIIKNLQQFKKDYQIKYRFRKIGIFGSIAKGTENHHSDIDIIVEQIEPDLFLLGSIKADLEEIFHMPVDVIRLRNGMNTFLKERIAQEAIYVRQDSCQANSVSDPLFTGYSRYTILSS